jgi:hypothetical protein
MDNGCREYGCNLPGFQRLLDNQKVAKLERLSERRKCWSGDETYCSAFDDVMVALDGFEHYDFGNGTIQVGFNVNGFVSGLGIRGDLGVAMDFRGNIAVIATGGGGGYFGTGGGVGGYLTVTNAPSVNYLAGPNVQIGGQIGEGETVGAEYVMFKGEGRDQYRGVSISDKAQLQAPFPFEFHGSATGSTILYQWNIPEGIANWFRP